MTSIVRLVESANCMDTIICIEKNSRRVRCLPYKSEILPMDAEEKMRANDAAVMIQLASNGVRPILQRRYGWMMAIRLVIDENVKDLVQVKAKVSS